MENHTKTYQWFKEWIVDKDHPCIMAQTVFRMDHVDFHEYGGFGTRGPVEAMLADLQRYVDSYDDTRNHFYTFIAAFPDCTEPMDEREFETKLWRQLQYLHDADDRPWDEVVAPDPRDENFSFSLKGRAFYVVGLHSGSSRLARQTPFPALAFNLHRQFEKLREMKRYRMVQSRIRRRDKKLQGSVNPELEDFGVYSEARQYSGRKTEANWKCPFHHH